MKKEKERLNSCRFPTARLFRAIILKTVPAMLKLAEFVHYKTKCFFRIAWCLRTNIKSSGEVSMIIFLDILITDLSAIYTVEKNGSGPIKKLPCKPSVPCFHEMDPDSLFSRFGATGGYGPKTEKRPDPFSCKALCKLIFVRYRLLHVSLQCFTVFSRMCTVVLFNHKP